MDDMDGMDCMDNESAVACGGDLRRIACPFGP